MFVTLSESDSIVTDSRIVCSSREETWLNPVRNRLTDSEDGFSKSG
jgi:hypothetical protein